ncbi:MAG TPA: carbohydrate porin, partial [Anaeromyxobacter sp.]|nr:carbohydrate porin [Anaeromyxobacter sp.]
DKAGVEVTAGVMFNYDQNTGVATGTNVPFGIQQNFFKMKVPQWAGATFWGGKQYYERQNIDMIDFFYLNTSDTGIGVEDVDVGFGKISFSLFGNGSGAATGTNAAGDPIKSRIYVRPDFRIYGMPINPGGALTIDLNLDYVDRNKDTDPKLSNDADVGFWVSVKHDQSGILGGNNMAVVQFATGPGAGMGNAANNLGVPGCGTATIPVPCDALNKNQYQFRALDALLLQPSNMFQVLIGGYYSYKRVAVEDVKGNITAYALFARPKVWLADYFALQGDIGYTALKPGGDMFKGSGIDKNEGLFKGTIAATLLPGATGVDGFYVRPEFRLFVTYASWNQNANNLGALLGRANGASSDVAFNSTADAKAGGTVGVQVES